MSHARLIHDHAVYACMCGNEVELHINADAVVCTCCERPMHRVNTQQYTRARDHQVPQEQGKRDGPCGPCVT